MPTERFWVPAPSPWTWARYWGSSAMSWMSPSVMATQKRATSTVQARMTQVEADRPIRCRSIRSRLSMAASSRQGQVVVLQGFILHGDAGGLHPRLGQGHGDGPAVVEALIDADGVPVHHF